MMNMRGIVSAGVVVAAAAALMPVWSCGPRAGFQVAVVSYVEHPVLNTIRDNFVTALGTQLDGRAIRILHFNAAGRDENLPTLAQQVMALHPDVIVPISTPVSQAILKVSGVTQKIVFSFVTNPADLGDGLTRANATGVSDAVNYSGNIGLIRDMYGSRVKIGMVYNPNEANSAFGVAKIKDIIRSSPTTVLTTAATTQSAVADAAMQMAQQCDVLYVGGDNTVVGAIGSVLKAGKTMRRPVFASDVGSIEAGAVAGISVDYKELGRKTAEVVKAVLRGAEPRTIPRVTMTGDRLIVNQRAAAGTGVAIPDSIVRRADQVLR